MICEFTGLTALYVILALRLFWVQYEIARTVTGRSLIVSFLAHMELMISDYQGTKIKAFPAGSGYA
ncbi:hypothetical protein CS542_10075 [Pedobacter sp. IW39]|nr:hypothetical protein CS542_10075 [Pedobacter sp. IW39]